MTFKNFEYTVDIDAGRVTIAFSIPLCSRVKEKIAEELRKLLNEEILTIRWIRDDRVRISIRNVGIADNLLCVTQTMDAWKRKVLVIQEANQRRL